MKEDVSRPSGKKGEDVALKTRGDLGCLFLSALFLPGAGPQAVRESVIKARNAQQFREAVRRATPGTKILLERGEYEGGFYFNNVRGETASPVVLGAADPSRPPVIKGGSEGLVLGQCAHVEVRDLIFVGQKDNGLNISDNGRFEAPAHHIVLRNLRVRNVGPSGNSDGIKLSGVDDLSVIGCRIERWGLGNDDGGSAIDMMGCHRAVIEGNYFLNDEGTAEKPCHGVQAKGGSREILIRKNRFEHAGYIAVHVGGSSNRQGFRPPLAGGNDNYEGKDITVEGNVFVGSGAPVGFIQSDNAVVRFNTIYRPRHWALRILHGENTSKDFIRTRNGGFTDNIVVFNTSDGWMDNGVNVSSYTEPQTFKFERNFWFCLNDAARSRPDLPAREKDGVYGQDPLFKDAARGELSLRSNSPAGKCGADALPLK